MKLSWSFLDRPDGKQERIGAAKLGELDLGRLRAIVVAWKWIRASIQDNRLKELPPEMKKVPGLYRAVQRDFMRSSILTRVLQRRLGYQRSSFLECLLHGSMDLPSSRSLQDRKGSVRRHVIPSYLYALYVACISDTMAHKTI